VVADSRAPETPHNDSLWQNFAILFETVNDDTYLYIVFKFYTNKLMGSANNQTLCSLKKWAKSWLRWNVVPLEKERKGKEEYLYSAFIQRLVSKRSDMDHTVLPANYTMPAFPS